MEIGFPYYFQLSSIYILFYIIRILKNISSELRIFLQMSRQTIFHQFETFPESAYCGVRLECVFTI
jgi:hypothetical protein